MLNFLISVSARVKINFQIFKVKNKIKNVPVPMTIPIHISTIDEDEHEGIDIYDSNKITNY